MSGNVSSLPRDGLARLQSEVESRSQATKERGRQWLTHREEYSKVKDRLETIDGKLQHDVMVPLTSKAMMPGKLVHTNQIMVLLGDNWFIETSAKEAAKIAGRRLEECEKMLRGLEEELRLNESWRTETKRMEGETEGAVDIREEFVEEEERKWREKHRENSRRERKGDASEGKEMTDGELWSRLEELEVREALEKEWEEDESDVESESSDEENEDERENVPNDTQLQRSVSWGNTERPVLGEGLRITFSHSDVPCPAPLSQQEVWPPRTPGDVCLMVRKPSKSILKPASSSDLLSQARSVDSTVPIPSSRSQSRAFPPGFLAQNEYFSQFNKTKLSATNNSQIKMDSDEDDRIVDYVPAISEIVVEKNVGQGGIDTVTEEPKRVSRFKASRTSKQN